MSRPTDQFARALDVLERSRPLLAPAWVSIIDGLAGQPRAQSYDPSTKGPVLYCDTHEGDLSDCPEEALCRGVPVDVSSDPTGDAAVNPDPCRTAEKRIRQLVARVEKTADELYDELLRHQSRPANAVERKATDQENDRSGCEVCARSGKWVVKAAHSDAAGQLPRALDLCAWHQRFALDHGRLPNKDEEATHQRGKKVTARVKQMDRLRRGLTEGMLS